MNIGLVFAYIFITLGSLACLTLLGYMYLGIKEQMSHIPPAGPAIQRTQIMQQNKLDDFTLTRSGKFKSRSISQRVSSHPGARHDSVKKSNQTGHQKPTQGDGNSRDVEITIDSSSANYSRNDGRKKRQTLLLPDTSVMSQQHGQQSQLKRIPETSAIVKGQSRVVNCPEVRETTMYKLTKKERDNDSVDYDFNTSLDVGKLQILNRNSNKLEKILSVSESDSRKSMAKPISKDNLREKSAVGKELYSQISSPTDSTTAQHVVAAPIRRDSAYDESVSKFGNSGHADRRPVNVR